MNRLTFLIILTTLLLGSCAPVTASPTQPVVDTVTLTVISSETPLPTPSAIPTITSYPSLHTQGPYLLFTRDHKSLTIMDADGSGRKQIQLPNDGHVGYHIEKAVSPDRKWIAYFTGTKEEPYDLALNLFNLRDDTSFLIANLIAPGFPQNLEPVTETAYFTEYDTDCSNDPKCRLRIIQSAFKWSIESLSWTPDGKSLAFAAQIDGPSSDVYIYDMDSKSVRRLTNELENIAYIGWSPNGKKILYETSRPGTIYVSRNLRIANPQSKSLQNPKVIDGGPFWGSEGWITEDSYVIMSSGEGAPPKNYRYINVETQQLKKLWEYVSEPSVFIPDKGMVFILYQQQIDADQIPLSAGTYFVSAIGKQTKISDEIYFPVQTQGNLADSFLAIMEDDNNLYLVSIDGSSMKLLAENVNFETTPSISPDKNWIVLETDAGFSFYSSNSKLVKTWNVPGAKIIWRPDSLGAFLLNGPKMYYLSIPDGEPLLIEDCAPNYCFDDFVWLP